MKTYLTKNNLLTLMALVAFFVAIRFGFIKSFQAMWLMVVMAVVFLLFANLDKISKFKFNKTGVEAETREIVKEAKSTIKELQDLSKIMALSTLGLVKRSGRWGGYSYDDKEKIKEETLSVLKKVGISDEECEKIINESKWHKYTEVDYVHYILGGSEIPKALPHERIPEWKSLRHRDLEHLATPEELTQFFEQIKLLNAEVKELINDYRYYIEYRKQRRPDIWKNRGSWSHFQKLKNEN